MGIRWREEEINSVENLCEEVNGRTEVVVWKLEEVDGKLKTKSPILEVGELISQSLKFGWGIPYTNEFCI